MRSRDWELQGLLAWVAAKAASYQAVQGYTSLHKVEKKFCDSFETFLN
jgi:hypothetical protein